MNSLTSDQVTQLITYGGGFLVAITGLIVYIGRAIADTRRKDRESKVEIDRKQAEIALTKNQADAVVKTSDAQAKLAVETANALVVSAGAERERLAAEASKELAKAVAMQLENLGAEVKRLSGKLETTEEKLDDANGKLDELGDAMRNQNTENTKVNDGLELRNQKLRKGLEVDGDRETLDKVLKTDDEDKIKQQKDNQ